MKNELFYKGSFGIERETLRVDRNGRLARTPHPFTDSAITRDFCENQIELVTPVCSSVSEAVEELAKLDCTVRREISKKGERLWMYSNPPYIQVQSGFEHPAQDNVLIQQVLLYQDSCCNRYFRFRLRRLLYRKLHFLKHLLNSDGQNCS